MNNQSVAIPPTRAERIGFAVTDAVTALIFLWTWVAPGSVFFADTTAMEAVYVVEFASLHAAGVLGMFIVSERMRNWQRFAGIAALGALYVWFFVPLGIRAGMWWPAVVMVLFVFSKIRHALFRRRGDDHRFHFGLQWGGSTALFVVLTFLAMALPWPHLGIAPDPEEGKLLQDGARRGASHALVVAGFLYFSAIAAIKYRWAGYFLAHRA